MSGAGAGAGAKSGRLCRLRRAVRRGFVGFVGRCSAVRLRRARAGGRKIFGRKFSSKNMFGRKISVARCRRWCSGIIIKKKKASSATSTIASSSTRRVASSSTMRIASLFDNEDCFVVDNEDCFVYDHIPYTISSPPPDLGMYLLRYVFERTSTSWCSAAVLCLPICILCPLCIASAVWFS